MYTILCVGDPRAVKKVTNTVVCGRLSAVHDWLTSHLTVFKYLFISLFGNLILKLSFHSSPLNTSAHFYSY